MSSTFQKDHPLEGGSTASRPYDMRGLTHWGDTMEGEAAA